MCKESREDRSHIVYRWVILETLLLKYQEWNQRWTGLTLIVDDDD